MTTKLNKHHQWSWSLSSYSRLLIDERDETAKSVRRAFKFYTVWPTISVRGNLIRTRDYATPVIAGGYIAADIISAAVLLPPICSLVTQYLMHWLICWPDLLRILRHGLECDLEIYQFPAPTREPRMCRKLYIITDTGSRNLYISLW